MRFPRMKECFEKSTPIVEHGFIPDTTLIPSEYIKTAGNDFDKDHVYVGNYNCKNI